jgi:primosomal replication protein N
VINYQENNRVDVIGYVDGEIVSSHRVHGEEFLTFTLRVPRLSETYDYINTTISNRLLTPEITVGAKVWIHGQYRSYNNYDEKGNKLILTLFVQEIDLASEADKPHSEIVLDGFICKEPVYRKTPFGREIADILLAVNRAYNKSDYIPCIAWGRNARFCEKLSVGQNIRITGRIQSREYQKKLSETEAVTKTAYEVSISRIETAEEEEEK